MTRALYCEHCHAVWISAAAHGIAQDRERCPRCGGSLTLEKPNQRPDHRDAPRARKDR